MSKNTLNELKRCAAYLSGGASKALKAGRIIAIVLFLAGQTMLVCMSAGTAIISCVLGMCAILFVTNVMSELPKNKLAASCEISQILHMVFIPAVISVSVMINAVFAFAASGYGYYGFLAAVLFALFSVADSIAWLLSLSKSASALNAVLGGIIGSVSYLIFDVAEEKAAAVPQSLSLIIISAGLIVSVSIIFIGTAVMYKSDLVARISQSQLLAKNLRRKGDVV